MEVTPEQIAMVQQSYEPLNKNAHESGKAFFKRFFELYPHTRTYFLHFSSDDDELFENPIFRAHCAKVINSVGTLIGNLAANNTSKNEEIVKKLAVVHKNRNIKPEHTGHVKHTLMDILTLERSSPLERAWINVLDALLGAYNEQLEEAWQSKG